MATGFGAMTATRAALPVVLEAPTESELMPCAASQAVHTSESRQVSKVARKMRTTTTTTTSTTTTTKTTTTNTTTTTSTTASTLY